MNIMPTENPFGYSSPRTTDLYPVYTGVWTNWSRGKIMGATLTLKRSDADFLIAFAAFFIAFISTRTWRILCFCYHMSFSTSSPQDAVYHQRQAILRNSSSPENGIYLLWKLVFAGRHLRRTSRTLLSAFTAIACVTIFTLAGGFSSRISTSMGNEVLIRSANCGAAVPPPNLVDRDTYMAFQPYIANKVMDAANHAQQCYLNNYGADCSLFVTPRLQSKQDLNASCPFSEGICRSKSGNIRLDSGFVDSHQHFGINSLPDQRIRWRQVVHCAPLITAGFTSQEISPQGFTRYHYGSRSVIGSKMDYVSKVPSLEYQYSAVRSEDSASIHNSYNIDALKISVHFNATDTKNSDFDPIAPLSRHDADTSLILLSGNGVTYSNAVPDEWYRVSPIPVDLPAGNVDGMIEWPGYLPSEPASPLGCTIQHQFCDSKLGENGCSPLSSLRDAVSGVAPFFDTDYAEIAANWKNGTARTETAAISYFVWLFFGFSRSIHEVFVKLGSTALLSQRNLISSVQGPMTPNQWQEDINYAWNISLALIQRSVIDTAYGPNDPDYLRSWVKFTSPSLKKLCNNQKILSTSYGSFSLVGLYSIFIIGFLITATSYLLEPVSSFLCKRWYRQYAHLEWTTNTVLQLQRLAHEELGLGTWAGCVDTVPTTKDAEAIASLDITNIHHPVLAPPEKQDLLTSGQNDSVPAETQSAITSTSPTGSQETADAEPSEMADASMTLAQIAGLREHEPRVPAQDDTVTEGVTIDESAQPQTGTGTVSLSLEEGSPVEVQDPDMEDDTVFNASRHRSSEPEADKSNPDRTISAATAPTALTNNKTLISLSRPIADQ